MHVRSFNLAPKLVIKMLIALSDGISSCRAFGQLISPRFNCVYMQGVDR